MRRTAACTAAEQAAANLKLQLEYQVDQTQPLKEALEKKEQGYKDRIAELESQVQAAEVMAGQLQAKVESHSSITRKDFDLKVKEVERLQKETAKLQNDNDNLRKAQQTLRGTRDFFKTKAQSLESENKSLKKKSEGLSINVKVLLNQVSTLEAKVKELKAKPVRRRSLPAMLPVGPDSTLVKRRRTSLQSVDLGPSTLEGIVVGNGTLLGSMLASTTPAAICTAPAVGRSTPTTDTRSSASQTITPKRSLQPVTQPAQLSDVQLSGNTSVRSLVQAKPAKSPRALLQPSVPSHLGDVIVGKTKLRTLLIGPPTVPVRQRRKRLSSESDNDVREEPSIGSEHMDTDSDVQPRAESAGEHQGQGTCGQDADIEEQTVDTIDTVDSPMDTTEGLVVDMRPMAEKEKDTFETTLPFKPQVSQPDTSDSLDLMLVSDTPIRQLPRRLSELDVGMGD